MPRRISEDRRSVFR